MDKDRKHVALATIGALALSVCVLGAPRQAHTPTPATVPHCQEDEILDRASVPGPWRCKNVEEFIRHELAIREGEGNKATPSGYRCHYELNSAQPDGLEYICAALPPTPTTTG